MFQVTPPPPPCCHRALPASRIGSLPTGEYFELLLPNNVGGGGHTGVATLPLLTLLAALRDRGLTPRHCCALTVSCPHGLLAALNDDADRLCAEALAQSCSLCGGQVPVHKLTFNVGLRLERHQARATDDPTLGTVVLLRPGETAEDCRRRAAERLGVDPGRVALAPIADRQGLGYPVGMHH